MSEEAENIDKETINEVDDAASDEVDLEVAESAAEDVSIDQPGVSSDGDEPGDTEVADGDSADGDCPACNKGAPPWMATFADMATLLMAFFVLLLSFSDTEIRKFEQINGSIQNAFGIKKIRPTIQIPRGRALLVQDYSPALSERTVINDPNQLPIEPTAEYLIRRTGQSENKFERELPVVSSALSNQIEAGLVQVKAINNQISVEVSSMVQENVQQQDQFADDQTAALLAVASVLAETQATVASEIYMSISETTGELAENSDPNIGVGEFYNNADRPSRLDEVRTQLTSQIEAGSLSVERVGEMIVISIASQGSFESGSAELEQQFYSTLSEIGDVVSAGAGGIRIEGHTDNIPIMFSDRFESNWELSAARAASVAAYFEGSLSIDPSRLEVAGFGETVPVDTNETAAGRANNRRIEIKIPD